MKPVPRPRGDRFVERRTTLRDWWTSFETRRRAGELRIDLQYGHIEEILATGLHAFLTQFLERVNELGVRISRDFLIAVPA